MNTVTVTRVSFGFPINATQEIDINEIDLIKKTDFSNKNVTLKVILDKALKKNFNQKALEDEIKVATNAHNIRIQFQYNRDESLRSQEVANSATVIDKFKKYAELTELKYKDSVLTKIEEIQDNMLINNFVPSESFELEYLSLRGAIGIKDGQGKDEISFNFKDDFSEGIIGLCGPNGAGKSTLIENMHPFPQMLTRSGALKEHFCLKDSHRILIYKMSNGKRIRISMLIDGCAKNVMTKYIVEYQKEGSEIWEPDTSIDGGFESYKKFCENKFGSLQLFMRTSFFANKEIKNIPDLSNATKSEKMELFSTLAGTDYLSEISEQAKIRCKNEEKTIDDIKGQLQNFDNIEQRLELITETIVKNSQDIENYKKLIDIDTQELEIYNEEQKKYLSAAGAYDVVRMTLAEKRSRQENNSRALIKISNNIDAYKEVLEDEDLYKQQIEWFETNSNTVKKLNAEISKSQDNKAKLQANLDKLELENEVHKDKINSLSLMISKLKTETSYLEKSIPDLNGKCPVCGASLSEHKLNELKADKIKIESKIKENNDSVYKAEENISSENKLLIDTDSIKKQISELDDFILKSLNDINTINNYAESIDIDKARDVVNNYNNMLSEALTNKENIEKEQKQLEKDITELEFKMNNIPEDYSDKINRLERGIKDSQQNIATLTADINSLKREKDNLDKYSEKVKEIKLQIKEHQQNVKDYTIIKDAFGNNGIQAMELDSAAPEISDITNSILYETYGDRFTLSFDTQRDAKDGHKINDFIIKVFDSKSGRDKTLDLLSSGEGIWIKQAMYYAFSVIRSRRTGFCFRTRFLDESDGALDSENRVKYLKMIQLAHKMCNATQTILITHSQEIKDLFEQKIEL